MSPSISIIIPFYNLEAHLEKMLKSVECQTFSDFEVLMIDDGSIDASGAIAGSFAERDERFKLITQKNRGVSEARNTGIDNAQGVYIVFYDGDDYIPKKALRKMYHAASKMEADITIGIMQVDNNGETTIATAKKFVRQNQIDPKDAGFIHAWSVCNKMFKRSFLLNNDIRFETIKHSEDAVFTYKALARSKTITGCNCIVYKYIKRTFWFGESATQTISKYMFDDLLHAHNRILEEAENLFISEKAEIKDAYFSKLCARFISNEVLEGFYKHMWKAESGVIELLMDKIGEYRKFILDADWIRIAKKHKDIFDGNRLLLPEEVKASPMVGVIISNNYIKNSGSRVLESFYSQQYVRFKVFIDKKVAENTPQELLNYKNIEINESSILDNKGEFTFTEENAPKYLMIAEEHIYPSSNSLFFLVRKLEKNEDVTSASCLVKALSEERLIMSKAMKSAYNIMKRSRPRKQVDCIVGNKLFRNEGDWFQRDKQCVVLRNGAMISDLPIKEFNKVYSQKLRIVQYAINLLIDCALDFAKTNMARDDLDAVLRVFRRDSASLRL